MTSSNVCTYLQPPSTFQLIVDFSFFPFVEELKSLSFLCNAAGITGLSLESFKENWSSDYQNTNNAGIPDPEGDQSWNFK